MSGLSPALTDLVELAARWVQALGPETGPLATGEDLPELAGRLALVAVSGLAEEPAAAVRAGEEIGRLLAEANLTGPDVVRHAVTALGDHWLSRAGCDRTDPSEPDGPVGDAAGIDPYRVTAMQGGLAAGHSRTVQRLLLAQQEAIHRATVSAKDAAQARLRYEASHDRLTGLPNRTSFLRLLGEALTAPETDRDRRVALCLLDLDGFDAINLAHGHLGGDLVLRAVARRLAAVVRASANAASAAATDRQPPLLARFGGDRFAVLLSGASPEDGDRLADALLACLDEPIRFKRRPGEDPAAGSGPAVRTVRVAARAAVVELPASGTWPDAALRAAELAVRTTPRPRAPGHPDAAPADRTPAEGRASEPGEDGTGPEATGPDGTAREDAATSGPVGGQRGPGPDRLPLSS